MCQFIKSSLSPCSPALLLPRLSFSPDPVVQWVRSCLGWQRGSYRSVNEGFLWQTLIPQGRQPFLYKRKMGGTVRSKLHPLEYLPTLLMNLMASEVLFEILYLSLMCGNCYMPKSAHQHPLRSVVTEIVMAFYVPS